MSINTGIFNVGELVQNRATGELGIVIRPALYNELKKTKSTIEYTAVIYEVFWSCRASKTALPRQCANHYLESVNNLLSLKIKNKRGN
tara:strand:+ start:1046 stop:1309 length:264 start_codon:yes stop_codon:yes gene_type:complete